MTEHQELGFTDFRRPQDVPPLLRQDLIDCWVEVTNAGGAAGFPFPPVTAVEPLIRHGGSVHHLQSRPGYRGRGIGMALMRELHRVARDELGLEQLHLAIRGRMGLEDFYCRLGWREVGRWPNKLRLAPDDTRDEVLMMLNPL